MTDFAARLLYWTASLIARLPWAWLRGMADAFARAWIGRNDRTERVVRRNLELAYPELLPAQRESLVGAVMRTTARQGVETLRFWTRPHAKNLALLRETHGVEMFDAAVASGHGVIVAAPHYGSWELLNQWLASRTPLAILYAPPESEVAEAFLRRVRAAHGDAGRVTQVRAEGPAIRGLFKLLQGGGVAGILPDQQPKAGDGEFAPFFGKPALTMSLLTRLAARTGATVLLCYCESVRNGFALHVEPAPDGIDDPDPQVSVAALNAGVERIARRDPAQYQWTYKRYTLRPPDSGESNPYHPDCY